MRIVVLDGNENQAVACVRSLGRAGHHVEVGSSAGWSKAGWSRHSRRSFKYPAPETNGRAFVEAIAREAASVPGTLVLPMTERTTLPISTYRHALLAVGARFVLPEHDIVLRTFDKSATTQLAASLGVPVPATHLLVDDASTRAFAARAIYPVVVKPRSSEEVDATGRVASTGAPRYARNALELMGAWQDVGRRSPSALAQEYVEGGGSGFFALMRHGEVRAEFAHRRIRDVRPSGSGSALRESVLPDPVARQHALKILGALQWHGVAMVEFRVRPDGSHVFLEVNGRFWNSLALAVCAGVDFPAMLATMAEHGDVPTQHTYAIGTRCRWLLGDARHLLAVMTGRPAGYGGPWPSRLATLGSFLTPVPGTFHDNFRWDDPLPEAGDWIDFLGRKLPRALFDK